MKILLAGGGTGGPIAPLIAVQQKLKENNPYARFLFIGTGKGLEREMLEKYAIHFESIPAGKFRRYFSLWNFFAPFQVAAGFVKAIPIIKHFNPDAVFAAGGYVAVPVVFAARVLRKKIIIHQQDYAPSLTNQVLAPFADKITVTFEHSEKDFHSGSGFFGSWPRERKIYWTGNPVRAELLKKFTDEDKEAARKKLKLAPDLPVLLVLGGATGALALNGILLRALPQLVKFCQVIHICGAGKKIEFENENYHPFEFVADIGAAYALADIVLCRAGLSTISELSALKKAAIVVPMPQSHQEDNAGILMLEQAAVVAPQSMLSSEELISLVRKLMYDGEWQESLKENIHRLMPHNADEKIAKIIEELCQQEQK